MGDHLGRTVPQPTHPRAAIAIEEISLRFTAAIPPRTLTMVAPASSNRVPFLLLAVWACGFTAVAFGWGLRWRRIRAAVRAGRTAHRNVGLRADAARRSACAT